MGINVSLQGRLFIGQGQSKKAAKNDACAKALQAVYNIKAEMETPTSVLNKSMTNGHSHQVKAAKPPVEKSPLSQLNELDLDENKQPIKHEFELLKTEGVAPNQKFTMRLEVKGEYYFGNGPSKKEAKQAAAHKALKKEFPHVLNTA